MATENSLLDEKETRTASRGGSKWADIIISSLLLVMGIIALYPFYNVFIVSLGSPSGVFLPTRFDLTSYNILIDHGGIIRAFVISVTVTIIGTFLSMFVTTCAAYALSKKKYPFRNVITIYILFTMFFAGGLIPYYLLVKNIGLIDSYWVMVVPTMMNAFYLMIMMSFFRVFPESLEESAKLDGCSDFMILIRIVLPTSTPVIAAISLFYALDKWNDWWHPMLFVMSLDKYPLQLLTRNLIVNFNQIMDQSGGAAAGVVGQQMNVLPDNLKMAVIVFNIVPVMLIYPFIQKYFAKGVMLGSVKG